jgi:hypothetical protein
MQRFIHLENIRHYKQLLERTTDEAERARILKLMAEEEAKERAPEQTAKTG